MKKKLLLLILLTNVILTLNAQDYFSDLNSGTTPILISSLEKALFSATLNVGDNSVKANFYRQYWSNKQSYNPLAIPRHKNWFGWGLNMKAKTEDGLGPLFSSGEFNPGFTGGGYLSFSRMYWYCDKYEKETFGQWAVILSGTLSTSNFQLYQNANPFTTQLSDTVFNGRSLSLSFVSSHFIKNSSLFWGISVTASRINNYAQLDKVDIKNDSVFTNGAGLIRTVQIVNENGNIYAIGAYQEYANFRVRSNISYIPGALNQFMAFVFYPSVDFSKVFQPKYNLGLSFAHLKKDSPSISDAALFFELNDMSNVAESKNNFFKRSFKFGISTTLNIFTSSK